MMEPADTVARAFLSVERSATEQRWVSRLDQAGQNRALAMSQIHAIPELIARVLAGRGVGVDDALAFLDPTIRSLMPDPHMLTDCEKAAERLVRAIETGEKVAIFGDYDVDGAASSALMYRFLAHFGLTPEIYIPDRIFEGYGPNPAAMQQLAANGATLIVTVDCGSTSHESLQAAKDAGTDVVVIDHHQVGTEPAAGGGAGQSQPRGRSFGAGASLCGRRGVPRAGRHPAPIEGQAEPAGLHTRSAVPSRYRCACHRM